MSILESVLNYKARKDAEANQAANAIPQAVAAFISGRQQQVENQQKNMLLQIQAGQAGYKIDNWNLVADPNSLVASKNLLDTQYKKAAISKMEAYPAMAAAQASEKQDAADQKSWEKIVRNSDPALASSRSTIGMAANGNLRADRALDTLTNNKILTNQDAQNVVADIAGIYAGGAPSDMGMKHSQYESIQQTIAGLQQKITGKPTDALPQGIREHLSSVIAGMKQVNNEAIKNHFNYQEKANAKIIAKYPDEWKSMKESYLPSQPKGSSDVKTFNSPEEADKSGLPSGTIVMVGNRRYKI